MTTTGDVEEAALSPDARYLAAIRRADGEWSPWPRQLATGSDVELLAPQGVKQLHNPVFSPDGDYLNYSLSDERGALFTNYRLPVLGGTPRRIVVDIDTPVTFSPDGSRIAYLRNSVELREQALLVAAADGSGERTLATRRQADGHTFSVSQPSLGPSWSPDGRTIAVAGFRHEGELQAEIVLVDAASGEERGIGGEALLGISGIAWLPEGDALIVACRKKVGNFLEQIWRVSLADGRLSRITNDSLTYSGVSLGAAGESLVSVQQIDSSTLWRRSVSDGVDRQLTFGSRELLFSFETAASGELYFSYFSGGVLGIARTGPEGEGRIALSHPDQTTQAVQVSRDGRTLVFYRLLDDGRLALMVADREGNEAREVPCPDPTQPFLLHPDGSWILTRDARACWRQPIDGSPATPYLEGKTVIPAAFSPDGTRLLYFRQEPTPDGSLQAVAEIVPTAGGDPIFRLERFPGLVGTSWYPDGGSLVARIRKGSESSLWRFFLDGRPRQMISDFGAIPLGASKISPDGASIFYTRQAHSADAVLIENFR
ncbi:MAG: hypothetical protein R2862_06485 [Thermoanaerobaculia bacterium]